MARRKVTEPKKQFVLLCSECGGASQLAVWPDNDENYIFDSKEDAIKLANEDLQQGNLNSEYLVVVAEVVTVGTSNFEFIWNARGKLE